MASNKDYLKLIGPVAIICYMILGILRGEHHLPGRDPSLSDDPFRFWVATAFFLSLAIASLLVTFYKRRKDRLRDKSEMANSGDN